MKADCKRKAALVHVVFQLTIFMIFMKAKATAEMVEGCIESQMTLSCNETKVINISSVLLGDSWCAGIYCCATQNSCTAKPNDSHVNDVHRQCNGRQRCAVNVIKEKIPCGRTWIPENNDFERIVYDCIDNGKMVEGCIESQLTLSCDERKVINISSVVLGDSWCTGTNCCPKHDSCTAKPNDNHVNGVHRRCNGRQRCTVYVIKEPISCTTLFGLLNTNQNNGFERIVYDCIDNGRMLTTKHYTDEIEYTAVTETSISEDAMTSNEPEMLKGTEPMPIIIAIVCLLVLITVIVVIVVIVKRKRKKSQLNANSNPAKLSVLSHDVDDTAYEEIATNGDRTYEKFVPAGTEDFDNHTYAGLVTK